MPRFLNLLKNTKDKSNANNNESNNEKILDSSALQHETTTRDSTTIHQTTTMDNNQSSPVESAPKDSSSNITPGFSTTNQSKEKINKSTIKISTKKKHSDKMEKNLKSGKIIYPPEKSGYEKIIMDAHKKVVDVAHASQKEGEKNLIDVTKNGTIKDHIKWVKTCVN